MLKNIKKGSKGITLIALIITIIVMLILVGVTINVALNGGLFTKAETAVKGTQKAVEEELLMSAILTAYDVKTGVVGKTTLETELKKDSSSWTVTGEEGGPYGVTSPKGNAYTVTKDGKIAEGWVDNGNGSYTKGDTTVTVGETTYTHDEVLTKLGIEKDGNYKGTYTGTWTVIGVEGDRIKLASTANVTTSSVYLGYNDEGAKAAKPAVDENAPTDEEKLERSIWSYQNAVDTLNKAASDATGIESAESITLEDLYGIINESEITKSSSYGKIFRYYFVKGTETDGNFVADENGTEGYVYSQYQTGTNDDGTPKWSTATKTSYTSQTFVKDGNKITINKDNPTATVELTYDYINHTWTDDQKAALGSFARSMWLASPCVLCDSSIASFYVRLVSSRYLGGYSLFISYGSASSLSSGVCAVVSI